MPEEKKRSGCLRVVIISILASLLGCIAFLAVIAITANKDDVLSTTDVPASTNIPVNYEQELASAREELIQNMTIMGSMLQDPDAGRLDIRAAILAAVGSYGKLSNLDYSPEQAQEHATTVESLSSCGESSKWFNNAFATQDIATYDHAIEQGWLWFDECRLKLGF